MQTTATTLLQLRELRTLTQRHIRTQIAFLNVLSIVHWAQTDVIERHTVTIDTLCTYEEYMSTS